jgi:hypothetical protein
VDPSHRGTSLPLWSAPQGNQLHGAWDGGNRLRTEQVLSRFPTCKFQLRFKLSSSVGGNKKGVRGREGWREREREK